MTEEKKSSLHETSVLLCEAYNTLVEKGQVTFALNNENVNKVDSIVKTIYSNYYTIQRFLTIEEKAAAFFCYIIKDHPFIDGNKRTATLWVEIYSNANSIVISPFIRLDELAVAVEKEKGGDLYKVVQIVKEILFG